MKIALVTETYPPEVNGVAMTLERLTRGLLDRGHEVQLIRPAIPNGSSGERRDGFSEIFVRGSPIPGYKEMRFGWPCGRRLATAWKDRSPEVVHVATEGPLGWSAVRTARRLGIPIISTFHTNFHSYVDHYGLPIKTIGLAYLRYFHNKTDATFAPTRELSAELSGQGFHNMGVLGRGVDTARFSPDRADPELKRSWAPEGGPVVLYVGRLAAEKNLSLGIEAFLALKEINPKARLVLVGSGPLEESLKRDHPEFIFCGTQRGEALAAHYASADFFFFPSLTDTFGNVVTEAMASGLPVLAFDYAAPRELIRSGQNGVLVPCGEGERFVTAARELAGQTGEWKTMGREARKTALQVDWKNVIDYWEEQLQLAARKGERTVLAGQ